jgi:hypothetical protein
MLDGTARVAEGSQIECVEEWREVDRMLRMFATCRRALDLEEAEWLVKAERMRIHTRCDCGSFLEYVEQVLGYGPRTAVDRLRVARALDALPALRTAGLAFSALRELARVVTPDNVDGWITACKGQPLRVVEQMVRGHKRGDHPDSPSGPADHMVRFELAPEAFALLREVQRDLAGELGHDVDDSTLINQLCRAYQTGGGAGARKKPTYSIAITTCDRCDRAFQDGGGVTVEVSPAVRDAARCDAAHVGRLDAPAPTPPTVDIPAAVRALVWRRDHGRCRVPNCRARRNLELHHIRHREHGGDHEAENLILLCSGHHAAHHTGTLQITGPASRARIVFLRDPSPPPPKTIADDAIVVLKTMGYAPREARAAVAAAHVGEHPALDALVRAALQTMPRCAEVHPPAR